MHLCLTINDSPDLRNLRSAQIRKSSETSVQLVKSPQHCNGNVFRIHAVIVEYLYSNFPPMLSSEEQQKKTHTHTFYLTLCRVLFGTFRRRSASPDHNEIYTLDRSFRTVRRSRTQNTMQRQPASSRPLQRSVMETVLPTRHVLRKYWARDDYVHIATFIPIVFTFYSNFQF